MEQTKKDIKSMEHRISVMRAYIEGAAIEYRTYGNSEWIEIEEPIWNWSNGEYRKREKDTIDWSHVDKQFNYLARDESGDAWLYEEKPTDEITVWVVDGGLFVNAGYFSSYKKGSCGWRESLVERPK